MPQSSTLALRRTGASGRNVGKTSSFAIKLSTREHLATFQGLALILCVRAVYMLYTMHVAGKIDSKGIWMAVSRYMYMTFIILYWHSTIHHDFSLFDLLALLKLILTILVIYKTTISSFLFLFPFLLPINSSFLLQASDQHC